jgi:hypothetical protein
MDNMEDKMLKLTRSYNMPSTSWSQFLHQLATHVANMKDGSLVWDYTLKGNFPEYHPQSESFCYGVENVMNKMVLANEKDDLLVVTRRQHDSLMKVFMERMDDVAAKVNEVHGGSNPDRNIGSNTERADGSFKHSVSDYSDRRDQHFLKTNGDNISIVETAEDASDEVVSEEDAPVDNNVNVVETNVMVDDSLQELQKEYANLSDTIHRQQPTGNIGTASRRHSLLVGGEQLFSSGMASYRRDVYRITSQSSNREKVISNWVFCKGEVEFSITALSPMVVHGDWTKHVKTQFIAFDNARRSVCTEMCNRLDGSVVHDIGEEVVKEIRMHGDAHLLYKLLEKRYGTMLGPSSIHDDQGDTVQALINRFSMTSFRQQAKESLAEYNDRVRRNVLNPIVTCGARIAEYNEQLVHAYTTSIDMNQLGQLVISQDFVEAIQTRNTIFSVMETIQATEAKLTRYNAKLGIGKESRVSKSTAVSNDDVMVAYTRHKHDGGDKSDDDAELMLQFKKFMKMQRNDKYERSKSSGDYDRRRSHGGDQRGRSKSPGSYDRGKSSGNYDRGKSSSSYDRGKSYGGYRDRSKSPGDHGRGRSTGGYQSDRSRSPGGYGKRKSARSPERYDQEEESYCSLHGMGKHTTVECHVLYRQMREFHNKSERGRKHDNSSSYSRQRSRSTSREPKSSKSNSAIDMGDETE